MTEFKNQIENLFSNCIRITDFDRRVYVQAYGETAVSVIEKQAEVMPDTDNPNMRIQAMLNIAYDKGFNDCIEMVVRCMENTCGFGDE